jgi:hypothetical protein
MNKGSINTDYKIVINPVLDADASCHLLFNLWSEFECPMLGMDRCK